MSAESILQQGVVYLGAAVVAVPVASRLGLGSVLGYLLAGVVVGPWALGLVGAESESVMHFAEFGVVMMLFLVGLELDPKRLWTLRGPVFGLGGLQVGATALAVTPLAMLVGLPWQQAVAVGLIVAMSSTAIALQSLAEKNQMKTKAGQTSFAILLLQDVAVIPILALFPLLATLTVTQGETHGPTPWIETVPAWQRAIVVLAAIAAVIGAGRVLIGRFMRAIARTGLREMFTAAALLIVIAVALLMESVGLSAALGTFIAGVVLANSEFRHELVSDVEPFKGLLLGVFFMAVGASIDFAVLGANPFGLLGILLALVLVKSAVLLAVSRAGKLSLEQGVPLALTLAQVGEFAFVLLAFSEENGILPETVTKPMVAVTAFSMAGTPFLLWFHERFLAPRLAAHSRPPDRASDVVDENNPVIIAGYGRFGQIAGRLLRAHGIGVTVLDVDSDQVDMVARFGHKAFYGDASRLDLLHAAGAHRASVLVVAVDDPSKVNEIVEVAKKHFPNLAILARARGRTEAYELMEHEVEGVYRETFDTAVRVGVDALRLLGRPAHTAVRIGKRFRHYEEKGMRDMLPHRHDPALFVGRSRERIRDFEQLLRAEADDVAPNVDDGWDSEVIRDGYSEKPPADPPSA